MDQRQRTLQSIGVRFGRVGNFSVTRAFAGGEELRAASEIARAHAVLAAGLGRAGAVM